MNQNKISLAKKTLQYLEKKKLRDINLKNFLSNIRYFILLFRLLFKIDFTLELLENDKPTDSFELSLRRL